MGNFRARQLITDMFTRGDGINAVKPTIVDKIDDGAGVGASTDNITNWLWDNPAAEDDPAVATPEHDDFETTWNKYRHFITSKGFGPASSEEDWARKKQNFKEQGDRGIEMMEDAMNGRTLVPSGYTQKSDFFTARVPVNYDKIEHIVENAVANLLNPAIAAMTVEPGNDQETDQEISEMEMDRATMEYLASKAIAAEAPPAGSRESQAPTVAPSPGDEAAAAAVDGVETGGLQSPLLLGGLVLLAAAGGGLVLWKLSKSSSQGG